MDFRETYRMGKRILVSLWSVVFVAVAVMGIVEGGEWSFRPLKLLFVMAVVWAVPLLIWEFVERKGFPELSQSEDPEEDSPMETDTSLPPPLEDDLE